MERVPEHLRRRPWRAARWVRPFAAMAASLFLLVTGAWVGMHLEHGQLLPGAGRPDVVREAAMAFAVYSPEVRYPVEVSGDEEPHLVAWLTKRMGAPLHVPRLDALGFRLLGGRLMSSDDGPGALWMYEKKEGRRVVYAGAHRIGPGGDRMRLSTLLTVGLCGGLCAGPAVADDLPPVKAGLWEIRSGSGGDSSGAVQQCIDEPTFREMLQVGQRMMGSACSPLIVRRTGDRYTADIRCLLGSSTMESSSDLTGDFQTSYRSVTRTSITPPLLGQAGSTEVSSGRFVGPCSPGMRPGDAIMPDGRRVNVLATMRQMPDIGGAVSEITRMMNGLPPPVRR